VCSSDLSNTIYEDDPDARDGAVPGCSSTSDNDSTTTYCVLQEDLSSNSNTMNLSTINSDISTVNSDIRIKKRKVSRSNEAITLRYAAKLKENYEEVQNKIMTENRCLIERLMECEQHFEKEIINNIFESQRSILKETTNQLLVGLQNIFVPKVPSQLSTVSVPTVNSIAQSSFVISPDHYSSPFSSNLESQAFHSSNPFRVCSSTQDVTVSKKLRILMKFKNYLMPSNLICVSLCYDQSAINLI